MNKSTVESVWNSCFEVGFENNFQGFGVPHYELAFVSFPIVNGCHEVAVIFILTRVRTIALLVIYFTTSMTFAETHLFDNFIFLLIKF